ncbi:unnamed protein product [Protopolystoma xenopodis]|uniref:Uncharacterized protein n=1 Tax=Protopolystoma xenopodis TaxID=117903 RepID=A0A448WP54_9PLAT|nr:unnamed protein product [Protopolystoma xenopodis]
MSSSVDFTPSPRPRSPTPAASNRPPINQLKYSFASFSSPANTPPAPNSPSPSDVAFRLQLFPHDLLYSRQNQSMANSGREPHCTDLTCLASELTSWVLESALAFLNRNSGHGLAGDGLCTDPKAYLADVEDGIVSKLQVAQAVGFQDRESEAISVISEEELNWTHSCSSSVPCLSEPLHDTGEGALVSHVAAQLVDNAITAAISLLNSPNGDFCLHDAHIVASSKSLDSLQVLAQHLVECALHWAFAAEGLAADKGSWRSQSTLDIDGIEKGERSRTEEPGGFDSTQSLALITSSYTSTVVSTDPAGSLAALYIASELANDPEGSIFAATDNSCATQSKEFSIDKAAKSLGIQDFRTHPGSTLVNRSSTGHHCCPGHRTLAPTHASNEPNYPNSPPQLRLARPPSPAMQRRGRPSARGRISPAHASSCLNHDESTQVMYQWRQPMKRLEITSRSLSSSLASSPSESASSLILSSVTSSLSTPTFSYSPSSTSSSPSSGDRLADLEVVKDTGSDTEALMCYQVCCCITLLYSVFLCMLIRFFSMPTLCTYAHIFYSAFHNVISG